MPHQRQRSTWVSYFSAHVTGSFPTTYDPFLIPQTPLRDSASDPVGRFSPTRVVDLNDLPSAPHFLVIPTPILETCEVVL